MLLMFAKVLYCNVMMVTLEAPIAPEKPLYSQQTRSNKVQQSCSPGFVIETTGMGFYLANNSTISNIRIAHQFSSRPVDSMPQIGAIFFCNKALRSRIKIHGVSKLLKKDPIRRRFEIYRGVSDSYCLEVAKHPYELQPKLCNPLSNHGLLWTEHIE